MVLRHTPSKMLHTNNSGNGLGFLFLAKQFVKTKYKFTQDSDAANDSFFNQADFNSRHAHFKYIWDNYIRHVVDKNYDKIGQNVNPTIIQIIKRDLLFSDHIIDKVLINAMYISLNIGFLHINNSKLIIDNKELKSTIKIITQKYESIHDLHYGKDDYSNSKISFDINLKKTNILKYYATLNLTLGLYFYYFGYNNANIDSRNFAVIDQFLKSNLGKTIDGVIYDNTYIKQKLIESIENDVPFNTMAILADNN